MATSTIVITSSLSGTITNTASVTANEADGNTSNNSATEDTVVSVPSGVPGVTTWGMLALAVLLAGTFYLVLRRRRLRPA